MTFHYIGHPRRRSGFSMIDVLVAIVVLATALLALAALQGAITRNTADSRARSQIAAFTEGLIEQARAGSYDSIAAQTITPSSTGTNLQKTAYGVQSVAGVSNLKVVETVNTYLADATGAFAVTTGTVASGSATYKQVNLVATWTDASGTARQLAFDTIVSPLQNSTDKTIDNSQMNVSQTPIVREYDPGKAAGVIPIAVSDDSKSAASNPKPEILATKGKSSLVVGTSYNVLTYQNPDQNTGEALIQQRVEAEVVGCKCQYGQGGTDTDDVFTQAFRPTYWDGTHYTSPKGLTRSTTSGGVTTTLPATNENNPGQDPDYSAAQSSYCTQCCRDHHDRADHIDSPSDSGSAADANYVYYDSWPDRASADTNTYNYDSNGALIEANGATDKFVAACRLLRVDGLFSTATDLHAQHFGLLATQTYPNATTVIPDATSKSCGGKSFTECYQDFAIDFMTQKYVDSGTPVANTVYASHSLDSPTQIDVTSAQTSYYMNARGLYVDYIEAEAAQAISDAYGTCPSGDTKANCVLPLVPFTAINTTELSKWNSCTDTSSTCTDATIATLQVFNAAGASDDNGDFTVSGYASKATSPTVEQAYAVATITGSNAGVAIAQAVDLNDESFKDAQLFDIGTVGSTSGGTFTVALGSYKADPVDLFTNPNFPTITWSNGSTGKSLGCTNSSATNPNSSGGTSNPNPYTCQPDILASTGTSLTAIIAGYNPTVDNNTNQNSAKCTTLDGVTPGTTTTVKMTTSRFCPNFDISTISVSGGSTYSTPLVSSDTLRAESTSITFAALKPSDVLTISFNSVTLNSSNLATLACVTKTTVKHGVPTTTIEGTWNSCP